MFCRFHVYGLVALTMTASACARVEVTKLKNVETYKEGIRFFRPAPYVVTSLEKDGCTHRIVYLPDRDEEYVIRVLSGYGAVDAKATLADGWNLTSLGETRDSKIPETITAVGGLLTAATPKAVAPGEKLAVPRCEPGIFKMVYDAKAGAWGIPR